MEKAIIEYLAKTFEPQTVMTLVGLLLIYKIVSKLECGVRAGLLSHITSIHKEAVSQGYITPDTLRILEEDYRQYHSLGGDGMADKIMADVRILPNKKPVKKNKNWGLMGVKDTKKKVAKKK